jgi:carbonic anhydrase
VINDVAFINQIAANAIAEGPLFEDVVIHHTQCGAGALAEDTFRRTYAQRIGADDAGLRDDAVVDPAATVTRDLERLRSAPAISQRVTFTRSTPRKAGGSPPAATTTDGIQIDSASPWQTSGP